MRRKSRLACLVMLLAAAAWGGPAWAIEIKGTLDIAGDLNITGNGSGLMFPDGTKQTSAAIAYRQIRVVSPVGSPVENGAFLLQTLNNILDAGKDRTYLVKIEPGTYDIGHISLQMLPYVDIEGSGELQTRIKGQVDSNTTDKGVLNGASNAELRHLTVMHTGGGSVAIGVTIGSVSTDITRVKISSSGATKKNIGIRNEIASPRLRGLTVEASGGEEAYGVWNSESTPLISGGRITANGATKKNYAVVNYNSGRSGPVMEYLSVEGSGGEENIGVYDSSGNTVMRHMTVMATGGKDTIGIAHASSSEAMIHMVNVRAESGTEYNRGIHSEYSRPQIVGGSVLASGGKGATGIFMSHADPLLQGVAVTVRNGSISNTGIKTTFASPTLIGVKSVCESTGSLDAALDNDSSGDTVTVSHSTFKGPSSVRCAGSITMNVGASQLDGPINASGTWHCTGCFDGSYSPLGSDCQ